ncbi:DUF2306 domain-containing protein [Olleya sp. HaHaR_3_96]|uniref:DUF2306 domain-containing protein n=1 Tax=Olleya sp. HaHaR_3_96 TaxID=2745560 RepID=UPI001C4F0B48|nr:DUF2306 domain-containing protein [Olleya sp. HaHaR_3_96]QXP59136.1 DUF2306 domain-containing protein [Olleya sp. HaHaR_3_96]
MSYTTLMYLHLATILPAFVLGTLSFILKKGTVTHKIIGRIYMILMFLTAIITLFMPSFIGSQLFNHFGWIHLFSFLTIYTVPTAYIAIKKGDVRRHKLKMIGLYVGAMLIAGAFTFVPGRYMHSLFFT